MVAAGVPAIVVLVLSIGGGVYLSGKYLEREGDEGRPPLMTKIGVTGLVVAGVFWTWALLLTLFRSFDLGVVSFALAALASAYGAGVLPVPLSTATYKVAVAAGYGAVAANYALALVLVDSVTLRAYFALAAIFWGAMLAAALRLAGGGGLDADAPTTYSPI